MKAAKQACEQKREPETGDDYSVRSRGKSERMSADVGSVIFRILDPGRSGKIQIESIVDFVFSSSAQPSPAARPSKLPSPNVATTNGPSSGSIESVARSPSSWPLLTSAPRPTTSAAEEIGAKALYTDESMGSAKTLDPWARQEQLNNVFVPVSCLS